MRPNARQIGIAVLVVAAAVRLAFVAESASSAIFLNPIPGLDVDLNWRGAQQLRAGLSGPSLELMALSAPFYVHWTALMQTLFGDGIVVHRILGALSGALMPWLVFRLAYREEKRLWPAALVALFVGLLPSVVFMDTRLMKTSIEMALIAALLVVVPRGRAAVAGGILGVLFASQIMTAVFWIPVFAYWRNRRLILRALPGVAAGALCFFLAQHGSTPRFLPQGGVEVYLGNAPESRGYYTPRREIPASPLGHVFDARILAEAESKRTLTPAETNRHYLGKAWSNLVDNPGTTLLLWGRKTLLFFNDFEPPSEDYLPRLQEKFWYLSFPLGFGTLVFFALFGAVAMWRDGRRRLLGLYGGIVLAGLFASLLAFVSWRFRLHAVVPLALLAAAGLRALVALAHDERRLAGVVTVAGALLAFFPIVPETERRALHEKLAFNEKLADQASTRTPSATNPRALAALAKHTEAFRVLEGLVPAGVGEEWKNVSYVRYLCWLGEEATAREFLNSLGPARAGTLRQLSNPYRVVLNLR